MEELRKIIDELKPLSRELFLSGSIKQPNYIVPMVLASAEALCVGAKRISAIEFGVANGRGLFALVNIADAIMEKTGIQISIYGFDTFAGLPPVRDYRDHPEIWEEGQYTPHNFEALKKQLPENCELVVGDVERTVRDFYSNQLSASSPVGFVSVDLDFYSSTKSALTLFDGEAENYLPAVLMYFDDIDGNLTLNKWCGEELAIEEFNFTRNLRKIQRKVCNSPKMFCCHILDHPVRNGKVKPLLPIELPVSLFQR